MSTLADALAQAQAYHRAGQLAKAEPIYRQIIQVDPDQAEAIHFLGLVMAQMGHDEAALEYMERAIRLQPNVATFHNNLGRLYREMGRSSDSIVSCRRAVELNRDHAVAHNNLALSLRDQGKANEAALSLQRAIRLEPNNADFHYNLAMIHLLLGQWRQGWPESEWRWKIPAFQARHDHKPRWRGESPRDRTILIWSEQGLGDTIQFIRYASLLHERGATVFADVQPDLIPLLKSCNDIAKVVEPGEPLPDFDFQVPLLSLPGLFDTTLETIPARVPYLSAAREQRRRWHERFRALPGLKIGFSWQGNPNHLADRRRSVKLDQFASLLQMPDTHWFSLQKGAGTEQLATNAPAGVVDLNADLATWCDTAAVILELDLVLTVDTEIAHLAGALGTPVWVMLPYAPDWRWLLDREDSPWYPSMRLFRQHRPGDWAELFARVASALPGEAQRSRPNLVEVKTNTLAESSENRNSQEHYSPLRRGDAREQPMTDDQLTALNDRGISLAVQGDLNTAVQCFRHCLTLKPNWAECHFNLGTVLLQQGQHADAIVSFQQALKLNPAYVEAHGNLGNAYQFQGKIDQAVACYRRTLDLRPTYAEAHNNLGAALQAQGQLNEAAASYRRAIELRSDYAEAHGNLGNILKDLGKLDEAIVHGRRAVELQPASAAAHDKLGQSLEKQGRLQEAAASYNQALALKPNFIEVLNNLGNLYKKQGRLDAAILHLRRALDIKPDYAQAHFNLSTVYLLTGDWQQGWPEFEWRWKCAETTPRPYPQPIWDGVSLGGKIILLWCEQGLGDTLQFIRYAPLVKARGGKVVLECLKEMVPLLSTVSGIDTVIAKGESLPKFDVHAPLMSLPNILKTTLENVPNRVPYLSVDPALVEFCANTSRLLAE